MAIKLKVFSDKKIIPGTYNLVESCLVDRERKLSYSVIPESYIVEELLDYWKQFPHNISILYSTMEGNKYATELNIDVFQKMFNWGYIDVDFSGMNITNESSIFELISVNNEDGLIHYLLGQSSYYIKEDEGLNFWLVHELRNQYKQVEIRIEFDKGFRATYITQKDLVLSYSDIENMDHQDVIGNYKFIAYLNVIDTKKPKENPWQLEDIKLINNNGSVYFDFWKNTLTFNKLEIILNLLQWGTDKVTSQIAIDEKCTIMIGNWSERDIPEKVNSVILVENPQYIDCEAIKESIEYEKAEQLTCLSEVSEIEEWIENTYDKIIKSYPEPKIQVKKCHFNGNTITGNVDRDITVNNYPILLDIKGDEKQILRKVNAIRSFEDCNTEITNLYSLLAEGIATNNSRRHNSLFTHNTVKRLFYDNEKRSLGNIPNASQKEAIQKSINSQDLVVIQGPPGTGKTTVARSIAERLCEIYKNSPDFKMLLTSYQNVAVDNITERVIVGGFPVLRDLKNEEVKAGKVLTNNILKWRDDKIYKTKPSSSFSKHLDLQHKALVDEYYNNPFKYRISTGYIDDTVIYKCSSLIKLAEKLLSLLISDGFSTAIIRELEMIINDLNYLNNNTYLELLDRLSIRWVKIEVEEYLSKIVTLESSSEDSVSMESVIIFRKKLKELLEEKFPCLIKDIEEEGQAIKLSRMTREDILLDFTSSLENEDLRLRNGINKWGHIYSSTLQRTDRVKELYDVDFHSIIVDEAGRSNPLDLLIPLTNATKRVILLGDQKQLPPFIENKIEKMVENETSLKEIGFLNDSFFSKMYNQLKELGKTVFLNEQFRFHPESGEVVSNLFYDGELKSPRDPNSFYDFEGFSQSIAWIDCNSKSSIAKKSESGSWYRDKEINLVSEKIKDLKREKSNIYIGVITPYSEQRDRINQRLIEKEGVLVGAIDAFQGREFDVVILSLVRTKDDKGRTYGHLECPHRLCVALSRHKSLLVVIGDKKLVTSDDSLERLEDLGRLYESI